MNRLIRLFDVIISIFALLICFPVIIILVIIIKLTSHGPVLFRQVRVGQWNKDFQIYKFRTMHVNAAQLGSLTVGSKDVRITGIGYYLRKYKMDELPQLINVLKGDMSIVGPRPELRKYVDMYSNEQKKILSVKPGITDYASIEYRNENELLATSDNPEQFYIQSIMPRKIFLNNKYLLSKTPLSYFKIIIYTIFPINNKSF